MSEKIIHLLKPKEFRVWCAPNNPVGTKKEITNLMSKCTCVNCLDRLSYARTGKGTKIRASDLRQPDERFEASSDCPPRCPYCGLSTRECMCR